MRVREPVRRLVKAAKNGPLLVLLFFIIYSYILTESYMLIDYYSIVLQFHIPARNSGEQVDQKLIYYYFSDRGYSCESSE